MPPRRRETPPSLEVFGKGVRDNVVKVGREFREPDDDWIAVAHFENEDEVFIEGLVGALFVPESVDGGFAKDLLAEFMVWQIRARHVVRFALVMSTWQIRVDKKEDGDGDAVIAEWRGRISEHPDRYEAVCVLVADRHKVEMWMAKIIRFDDRPPQLAPWEVMSGSSISGRWVDVARSVLTEESRQEGEA